MPKETGRPPSIPPGRAKEITEYYGFQTSYRVGHELNSALGFYSHLKNLKRPTTKDRQALLKRAYKSAMQLAEDLEKLSKWNPGFTKPTEPLEIPLQRLAIECKATLENMTPKKSSNKDTASEVLLSYLRMIWHEGTGSGPPKKVNTWSGADGGKFLEFCQEIFLLAGVELSRDAVAQRLNRLMPVRVGIECLRTTERQRVVKVRQWLSLDAIKYLPIR